MSDISAAAAGTWELGDLTVNRLGFGAMRITTNPDRSLAIRVLRRAVELGVNHIDTAAFYASSGGTVRGGDGGPVRFANELIREALSPYLEELVITTKVGPGSDPERGFYFATTAAELRAQVELNLRQLGRDHLDVVNLRLPDGAGSLAEHFGWLAELRDAGLIRHLGISNVRPDHLDEAQAIAPVVCVQNSYALDVHRQDDDFVKTCGERGVAFVPFFAILGAEGREGDPKVDHTEAIAALAATHDATPAQIRLAWSLHQGPHVLAIPGTGNPAHLEQNITAAAITLSTEDLASLN